MGVQIAFDYGAWTARYPEFASVAQDAASQYFAEATLYHANDGSGPVDDAGQQSMLLNMLTAHIAARYATLGGQAPSPLVGRIDNASEGSVSVHADMGPQPGSAAWYMQTKYGADYWRATAVYRTMHYRAGPRRFFSPVYPWRA